MRSWRHRDLNSVARSPARTRDRYGSNTPWAGRSLNRFSASVPKRTMTGTPVFFAEETDGGVCPVHVLAFQVRNVALTRAQVPAQPVKGFPFRVHLGGDDLLMFLKGDCGFVFELDGGPLAFGDERPRQP